MSVIIEAIVQLNEENEYIRDITPYKIFRCSKCKQYLYTKQNQKKKNV